MEHVEKGPDFFFFFVIVKFEDCVIDSERQLINPKSLKMKLKDI